MNKLKAYWRELLIFLSIMGPGIITANVDNDAGGITTYSVAGAHFGYSLIWSFVPIIIALIIIQEMCSRMAVVTGKGLADLIREEFGVRVTFYAMTVLVFSNIFNTISEFAGIAAASELFGMSKYLLVPACAIFVWWLIVKGTYKTVEKVFLAACLFYLSYIFSGFLSNPNWNEVVASSVKPSIKFDKAYLFMLMGVIGTTIAPWMQFYQQSSVVEKEIKIKNYKYSKMDVIVGSFVVNIVAIFIVVVCANTLFKHGIRIETAKDAALALKPLAGKYCFYLFAFGLLNASVFSACILPLSTAYSVCEGMGWEVGVNKRFREAPQFYTLYTTVIIIGAAVILLPNVPLITVMLVSQVTNGLLLPFVLIFMLMLVNNKRLMGNYTNSRVYNIFAIATIVLMIVLSVMLIFSYFIH
ncbi:MAG: Nramp family divalent metal transporter [Candidatus Omnitrophota bacterium]|nr:Nramp family divalent metal transporter [Candidatus Omnitrophota bacterium]MBU1929078.1 Nramp family divalent metal transporter [Candidatus Omnitrophota bacterium]MBU1929171.1 Nramp family divalent metal transporter [Candidatus Omnitrophota bacterium]MBU2035051.1 Nramp family divalent metal transporter [Candidatus Omnitrophota bacterium]MBU2257757.1 Nramp family divalent metal transporter [Candidatus Omnitrophota bacterium]